MRNSFGWACTKARCLKRNLSIFISNFAVDRRKKMKVAFVTFVFLSIFGTCVSWTPMEKIQKKHLCSSCDTKEKALQFSYDVLSIYYILTSAFVLNVIAFIYFLEKYLVCFTWLPTNQSKYRILRAWVLICWWFILELLEKYVRILKSENEYCVCT